MKLKLDLHPIFSEGRQIETALQAVIDEACEKRAAEIEIIPGKGSGALKKSVLRFLDRPEIKARYHRIEKDSDNWGRLFVHFHWDRNSGGGSKAVAAAAETVSATCFCCEGAVDALADRETLVEKGTTVSVIECPSCGSPNRMTQRINRRGEISAKAESGYEEAVD